MFRYLSVSEELFSPELGAYHSFGIAVQRKTAAGWQTIETISDIAADAALVEDLAARCTAEQLEPVHLPDVIEDAFV